MLVHEPNLDWTHSKVWIFGLIVNKLELNGRLARWGLLLEDFDYTVEYKLGCMHLQADHLSRLPEDMGTTPIDDRLIDDILFVVTST